MKRQGIIAVMLICLLLPGAALAVDAGLTGQANFMEPGEAARYEEALTAFDTAQWEGATVEALELAEEEFADSGAAIVLHDGVRTLALLERGEDGWQVCAQNDQLMTLESIDRWTLEFTEGNFAMEDAECWMQWLHLEGYEAENDSWAVTMLFMGEPGKLVLRNINIGAATMPYDLIPSDFGHLHEPIVWLHCDDEAAETVCLRLERDSENGWISAEEEIPVFAPAQGMVSAFEAMRWDDYIAAVSSALHGAQYAQVCWTSEPVSVYGEIGDGAKPVGTLRSQQKVQVLESGEEWARVIPLDTGEAVYAPADKLIGMKAAMLFDAETSKMEGNWYVSRPDEPIRIAPRDDAPVIATLYEGMSLMEISGGNADYVFADFYSNDEEGSVGLRGYIRRDAIEEGWGGGTVPLMRVQASGEAPGVQTTGKHFLLNGTILSVYALSADGTTAIGTSDLRLEMMAVPYDQLVSTGKYAECFFEATAVDNGVLAGEDDWIVSAWREYDQIGRKEEAVFLTSGEEAAVLAEENGIAEVVIGGYMNETFFVRSEDIKRNTAK